MGLFVLGSKEEPRITISCAIFSSGLKVLNTLSTQAEALSRVLCWAITQEPKRIQQATNNNFRIIMGMFDISVSELRLQKISGYFFAANLNANSDSESDKIRTFSGVNLLEFK